MHSRDIHAVESVAKTPVTRRALLRRFAGAGVAAAMGTTLVATATTALAAPVHRPDAVVAKELPFVYMTAVNGQTELWFICKAPHNGPKQIAVNTYGSDYDTLLFAYEGNTLIGQSDDSYDGAYSSLILDVTNGATYYFKVVEFGNYQLGSEVPPDITLTFRIVPVGLG